MQGPPMKRLKIMKEGTVNPLYSAYVKVKVKSKELTVKLA